MLSIKEYVKHPARMGEGMLVHFGQWLPDSTYLKIMFRLKMGCRLNLKNPRTFSEKLQWLKLYNRNPEYAKMVDKYAVKDYVIGIIGEEYVIPTLGVWDRPEDIDWDSLPDQIVLKTTHGGGSTGVVVCRDKKTFNRQSAVDKLNASLKMDIYRLFREWPYKNVPRRIIAERYIEPTTDRTDLSDYKWYCFNGEPMFCQVIQDRTSKETIDFFDKKWIHQDFIGLNPFAGNAAVPPSQPVHLEAQVKIATALSQNIPFSRIDLYEAKDGVYFGEITFYPMSGLGTFRPEKFNNILGKMISLPENQE